MMSERKEKTMLKWLKQKPSLHGHGALPIEKITDDPLATIQVHPHAKKNKNKANEIYAVSRVNPLFEEEDVVIGKEVFSPGGNSGSSGYDSASGPSDDDFPIIHNVAAELKDLQQNLLGRLQTPPPVITAAAAVTHSKQQVVPQLFINTENDVIHHEAAIVGPNGRPILQILEQNPNYVKSIALSVGNNNGGARNKRPLSPISESAILGTGPPAPLLSPTPVSPPSATAPLPQSKYNLSTSGSLYNKDAKKYNNYTTIDSIGNAKLIKKDSQYVRSIRIGGPTNFNPHSSTATKRSILEANRRFSSSSTGSSGATTPSRRPSVTFADDVGGGSRPGSRKPSMEQDSIVTESLLMMTSVGGGRFSASSSATSSRKTSVSSSQSKSQDESSALATSSASASELDIPSSTGGAITTTVDLEAFANSLRKSRPITQLGTRSAVADELDEEVTTRSSSSSKLSDPNSEGYHHEGSHEDDDDELVVVDGVEDDSAEKAATAADRPNSAASPTPRLHANNKKSHKSPFGGIADHYAAAKEIAKEIESYSNGSAKASTKKSLVRDLLYRGNRNASSSVLSNYESVNAIKAAAAAVAAASNASANRDNSGGGLYGTTGSMKNGFRTSRVEAPTVLGRETLRQQQQHHLNNPQLLLQTVEQQQKQIARALTSSPIYYETAAAAAYDTGGKNRRNGGSSSKIYSPSPVAAVSPPPATPHGGGGSDDWELVRVQQVYVKAGTSNSNTNGSAGAGGGTLSATSQDQQPHHHHKAQRKPNSKEAAGDTLRTSALVHQQQQQQQQHPHQGQDHTASTSTSSSSHRYPLSSKIPTTNRGKAAKKVVSSSSSSTADDGLPAGARSRIQNDDTDSGNSSDRTYAEVRLEIEGTKMDGTTTEDGTTTRIQMDASEEASSTLTRPENLPSKVMIVTGDSQNIVVDLSGVPLDLKNAIVSGTALITLPDGLDKMLQPGYTMITIPASSAAATLATAASSSSRPMSPKSSSSSSSHAHHPPPPHHHHHSHLRSSSSKLGKDGVITIGLDDNKPLVTTNGKSGGAGGNSSSSGNTSSDDECKLFATKNKAQIWDVIQQTVGKQFEDDGGGGGGGGGKQKKKITTIFPFHPNQDTYESPDFTIEGHRLDRQRKKVDQEKRRRCACRLCGMLFFLLAFLGVLVALSMIYTKGQRYFGSSV